MTLLSVTPGRVRLLIDHFKSNYFLFLRLKREILSLDGIRKVSVRPLTGHLSICYDENILDTERLLGSLKRLVHELERKEKDMALIFGPPEGEGVKENKSFYPFLKRIALNAMKDLMPKPLGWFF